MARICHLTVLNPALHSRIFYKEARSQAAAGHSVSIVGQDPAPAAYRKAGIRIVPTGVFGRMSRRRIFARQFLLPLAEAEQADIYQIHSPELLPLGKDLKAMRPEVKVIYDVHEDYAANIRAGVHYPEWAKGILLSWLKRQERSFGSWGDGVVYAEDCYGGLLDFDNGYTAFVRNKFKPPQDSTAKTASELGLERPYLLYTGTIAEEWGIFRTLDLWEAINQIQPMDLVVAGHTHVPGLVEELELIADCCEVAGRMHVFGGREYLPYEQVMALIEGCWAGTALYKVVPHIKDKMPTKFFEFMGLEKPLFFSENPVWADLNAAHPFGMEMGGLEKENEIGEMVKKVEEGKWSRGKVGREIWSWAGEERALLELLEKVLA